MVLRALAQSTTFALVITTGIGGAVAQDFPSRPVRMVVPFPAGGSGDISARTVGQKLSEAWGQPVVVENRPGGNTIVGAELVARAAPDGHTLLVAVDSTLTMNGALYAKLPYRPTEFAPVTLLVEQPLLLSAGPAQPDVSDLAGFLQRARANPGKLNVGVGAIITRVIGERLKTVAGIAFETVQFQGGPNTFKAILGGQVDFALSDIGLYAGAVREGKLRGLAVTGPRRSPALPNVPTLAEAGVQGIAITSWFGLVAPGGTPPAVLGKLNTDVRTALGLPDVQARLMNVGLEASPVTREAFAARIASETALWEKVIADAKIRLD